MNDDRHRLINRFDRAKDFLNQNIDERPVYGDLISSLESMGDRLQSKKLTAKIVSPSASLAASLLAKHEANESLRSLYEFQVVAPITQICEILQHCDLICLIYEDKHSIREHHYRLVELAQKQNVDLLLLVNITPANLERKEYADWQRDIDALQNNLLQLPFDRFIDLDRLEQLDLYQRSLINLYLVLLNNRLARIEDAIVQEIKRCFNREITSLWQSIKHTNAKYCAGEPLYLYQQQFRQSTQTLNQFRQQLIRDIKQAINHEKTGLLNPFTTESLIFNLRQLIDSAEVKIVVETEQTYLYLALTNFPQQPLLDDYVLELCQQRIDNILASQWSKINYVYGEGGLNTLVERTNQELNWIEKLINPEAKLLSIESNQPQLGIEEIVDPYCFKVNSRIAFDYNFTQSSWFRLFISALVGTAIYLFTWLYLGTEKYIGFMIIIFQIINLITGQNIKKAKLKQHTKELKRIVDRECQTLVRTVINYLTQALIIAVDRECQFYQQEYDRAIASAQNKLDKLKQSNEAQKLSIENLKRDRDRIIVWFD